MKKNNIKTTPSTLPLAFILHLLNLVIEGYDVNIYLFLFYFIFFRLFI